MTVDTLLTRYEVDTAHARHVADLALRLFADLRPLHELPGKLRPLLETGALLHNVGLHVDQSLPHIVGRDIVLDEQVPDLDGNKRAMVACLVAFHRKKVRPEQEPAYLRLGKKDQQAVQRMAALLRIADGLDNSRTQTTQIEDCTIEKNTVRLHLSGAHSAKDAARARKKADYWNAITGTQLDITHALASENPTETLVNSGSTIKLPTDGKAASTGARATISSHDLLSDVGRRQLRSFFQKLLAYERQVIAGDEDPEGVHQMRVATRRLRAILQIIADVAPAQEVRYFRKELQRLARALAPVRDSDVLLAQVLGYRDRLPEAERDGIKPLVDALQNDRASGEVSMQAYLQSERYRSFKRDFADFMTSRDTGWNTTLRVRDMVGSAIWQRYEELRHYEVAIAAGGGPEQCDEEILHEARISGKRVRYMLDTFGEAMGENTRSCVKPLAALQDHLGALQDIAVARAYVEGLSVKKSARPALHAYLESRAQERLQLLAEMSERWERVMGPTYASDLAGLLAAL